MHIMDNNSNNRIDADNNRLMRISKNDNRIMLMQMWILLITTFVFSILITKSANLIENIFVNVDSTPNNNFNPMETPF